MECVKKSFLTKEEAVNKIAKIQKEEGDNKKPIRSYKCDKCGNYHLTSWTNTDKKVIHKIVKERKEINSIKRKIKEEEDITEYWMRKKGWNRDIK